MTTDIPDPEKRDLDMLLQLPWSREVVAQPGGGFVARVPDLDGCVVGADTYTEAFALLDGALEAWLSWAIDADAAIPTPRVDEDAAYSGRFSVRVPKSPDHDV